MYKFFNFILTLLYKNKMEPFLVIAIISVVFFILLHRLNKKIKVLTDYKKRTRKIADCLSQPQSMIVNSSGDKDLSELTCIQGNRYRDVADKYTLGRKAYPLQKCLEDDINFRVMVNSYGEQVCLSNKESNEIVNDVAISSIAKDCLVDDNGLPDVNKTFVVDSQGFVGCVDKMDIINNYMKSLASVSSTPSPTGTPTSTPI